MKTIEISKNGDWNYPWTDDLKKSINNSPENTSVGEHLLLETDKFKVWSIHLPKGKFLPFHKHSKSYFYTIKNKGKSRSFYADGTITETEYEKDDIKYFNDISEDNYFIHNLENIGNTTLIFTTVEFKK
jgi:hypothetical protein